MYDWRDHNPQWEDTAILTIIFAIMFISLASPLPSARRPRDSIANANTANLCWGNINRTGRSRSRRPALPGERFRQIASQTVSMLAYGWLIKQRLEPKARRCHVSGRRS
jgi:hypothetical protein